MRVAGRGIFLLRFFDFHNVINKTAGFFGLHNGIFLCDFFAMRFFYTMKFLRFEKYDFWL